MTITREYASPVDTASYGDYQFVRQPGDDRPLYRFGGRIAASASATGTESWPAEPGRYHLYAGWFCPWSQRITIAIALHGLCDTIGVSYLDDSRDGRGWAFRERRGADPVNGFTLLREAYQATDPGFDGHISTPALWDRKQRRLVSNDYRSLGLDIATEFPAYGDPAIDSYPVEHRAEIDELDRWLGPTVNHGVSRAATDQDARAALLDAFDILDVRLTNQRYLLGSEITEADIRLFVTLVRYDVQANADHVINPGLAEYPQLWAYARDLYAHPAFGATTDFSSFAAPGVAIPDWQRPSGRESLADRGSEIRKAYR